MNIFSQTFIETSDTKFNVYYRKANEKQEVAPLLVFHHGAGFTAQSFLSTCIHLLKNGDYNIILYDCRLHGRTVSTTTDMSLDRLSTDLWTVVDACFPNTDFYEYVLVGHSMGGAVVVDAALKRANTLRLVGVVVIDIVEGTAIDALLHMKKVLTSRPRRMESVEEAINYNISCGAIKNVDGARISVSSQLKQLEDGSFEWIADLAQTEKYWSGWFKGLSEKFLSIRAGRLLILANTDRLDKTLTIGQIQGKFQMKILHNVGHSLHEDKPDEFAKTLADFCNRNSKAAVEKLIKLKARKA